MLRLLAHASCVGFVYELYFYILKPHVSNLIYQDIKPPDSQVTGSSMSNCIRDSFTTINRKLAVNSI